MKIVVLSDNNQHPKKGLLTEHGLSIYFETDHLKWLFDTGASDVFCKNAQKLGVDIADVDYLVISHGHSDHCGGLELFLKNNNKANVIASAHIEDKDFYSYRKKSKRHIGIDNSIIKKYKHRFILSYDDLQIVNNVAFICRFPCMYPLPKANKQLFISDCCGERPDEFKHEGVLVIKTDKGIVVFSGCSHNGILNILEAGSQHYNNQELTACIGGTHLLDDDGYGKYETEMEIKEIAGIISERYSNMHLYTGHCTGKNAIRYFSEVMGNRFSAFHTGMKITL